MKYSSFSIKVFAIQIQKLKNSKFLAVDVNVFDWHELCQDPTYHPLVLKRDLTFLSLETSWTIFLAIIICKKESFRLMNISLKSMKWISSKDRPLFRHKDISNYNVPYLWSGDMIKILHNLIFQRWHFCCHSFLPYKAKLWKD